MDNYENFEQLRKQIMMIFEGKDGIPTEVKQTIQEMFNGLETKYREMGCYTPAIQEYVQGNLAELWARLNNEIGNRRKDEQFNDIQLFLQGVERQLEEKLDGEEQKRRDDENKEKIGEIANDSPNNIRITLNTMDLIEEYLRDVQSSQNRMLSARELYGQNHIEDMNEEIRYFITQLRSRNEERLHKEYQSDSAQLREEILQAFEEYTINRVKEEEHNNPFKEALSVRGMYSLEQQRADAERRMLESQSLGVDENTNGDISLADTLPESTL